MWETHNYTAVQMHARQPGTKFGQDSAWWWTPGANHRGPHRAKSHFQDAQSQAPRNNTLPRDKSELETQEWMHQLGMAIGFGWWDTGAAMTRVWVVAWPGSHRHALLGCLCSKTRDSM